MEGFKQGSDIICSFLKFKEWIKGRSVESGGPARESRKVIIIIAQVLTRVLVVEGEVDVEGCILEAELSGLAAPTY